MIQFLRQLAVVYSNHKQNKLSTVYMEERTKVTKTKGDVKKFVYRCKAWECEQDTPANISSFFSSVLILINFNAAFIPYFE